METLEGIGVVDGHDFGWGTFNIFVLTNEPTAAFTQAYQLILDEGISNELRSAYREESGQDYVILWPSGLTEFSVLWNSKECYPDVRTSNNQSECVHGSLIVRCNGMFRYFAGLLLYFFSEWCSPSGLRR